MLMGIGRLRRLASIRLSMLGAALVAIVLLAKLKPLDRFAFACAIGFSIAAIGLLLTNRTEQWGHPGKSDVRAG